MGRRLSERPGLRSGVLAAGGFAYGLALARADTRVHLPEGGGLAPLDVSVDLARGELHIGAKSVGIPLGRAALPDEDAVRVSDVLLEGGRHVALVRVPRRGDDPADPRSPAWQAVVASGHAPLFAAMTGLIEGDPGERRGKALQVRGGTVILGDIREDLGICGEGITLLDPLALYPASLTFRPATVQRLSTERIQKAEPVTAVEKGEAEMPLAMLLVARGSSVPDSPGQELTDLDPKTVWREERPGIGQGEFVTMDAPPGVPIARMQLAFLPPKGAERSASPRTLYVATNDRTFAVDVPPLAASQPGAVFELTFPNPMRTSCVSLVLGSAYASVTAHPNVGVSDLRAFSEFDAAGATLLDVARQLGGPRSLAASQVLARAPGSLDAVSAAFDALDPAGRALAVDVAATTPLCADAAPLFERALCAGSGEASRRARERLARCPQAAPELASRLRQDAGSRACVAPMLALLSPTTAIDAIAEALDVTPEDDGKTRAALRGALGQAVGAAGTAPLGALLGGTSGRLEPAGLLEALRGAGGHVAEIPAAGEAALAKVLQGHPPFRVRYLALEPLAALARVGNAPAAERLTAWMQRDPEWPVRARAAELEASIATASATDPLLAAARDPEPRVREAAYATLAAYASGPATSLAISSLPNEGWSFVRLQEVAVLLNALPKAADPALADRLHDASSRVRGAAVVALGQHRAFTYSGALRDCLDDEAEDTDVRAAAAEALGAVCDRASTDRLTALAQSLASPLAEDDARTLGIGALAGLAALHPADLAARVAPLTAEDVPPEVRASAARALAAPGLCLDTRRSRR